MENHTLLKELRDISSLHNVDWERAQITFNSYIELCEVKKLYDLQYHFNETLKMFYISGKKCKADSYPDVYIPSLPQDSLSPEDIENIIDNLCPVNKNFYLLIWDRDSSSSCYKITKGLVKPESPFETQEKKNRHLSQYQFEKSILSNKKKIFMKALTKTKADF